MGSFSEQKSSYKPYSDEVVSHARPPMIKKPNNLYLTGDIELFPEYRTSYVPYSLESVYKYNKPPCYHPKPVKKVRKSPPQQSSPPKQRETPPDMPDHEKITEAKILNNNYGVSCPNRYHQKLDTENNYMPEYRSKFQPMIAERSLMIPQPSHLGGYDDDGDFRGASEYTNRYKTYDHFTKSAPIKKEDNLHMNGMTDMRPEYRDRFKGDMSTFERRHPYRQADNLHQEGDFGRVPGEYNEKYRSHNASSYPERAKPRSDFLCLNGDMEYSAESRNKYVEFPRQRPIVKKPPSNIRMPSSHERDRKPDNIDLPINLSYHESGSTRPLRRMRSEEEDIPLECRPEYRRAQYHNLIKERSPSRASDKENNNAQPKGENGEKPNVKVTDPNDVSRILMDNKVNMPEEKIFDEKTGEVIVEPLKRPAEFKITTRSPVRHPLGKGPSYPLQKDHRFNEAEPQKARTSGRRHVRLSIDDCDQRRESQSFDDQDYQPTRRQPQQAYSNEHHHQRRVQQPFADEDYNQREIVASHHRKSPKFGRRAPNPVEDYNIRTKTNVVEANPRYVRERRSDIQPNRHEQRGYYHQSNPHPIPQAQPPSESLANNYRPNYEIDKQRNYRDSLGNDKMPFVVIDNKSKDNTAKQNSWMKKQWYDAN